MEGDIGSDSTGVLSAGITHAANPAQIVIANAGTYEVTFSVSTVAPTQVGLFVTGGPVAGAVYGSGAGTQQNAGQVLVAIPAGGILTLRKLG